MTRTLCYHSAGMLLTTTRARTRTYPVAHRIAPESIKEYPLKRAFDVTLASLAIALSLPLWAIVALAIKIEDRGPVFYPQRRWGKDKRPFSVFKFRSMIVAADEKFGPLQAQANDPRVTRVGRWLRATALDELPQVLNIWRGEMSWVGPRALAINEIPAREKEAHLPDEAIPGFDLRCRVRPGLTGVAQVYADRDVPRRHKFRYDLIYARKQSLGLDVRLIALSFWITFRARWEKRGRRTR